MKDLQSFLSSIVRLWSIHQFREDLYKRTLAIPDLGPLRRVFSQGYSSSLLYKKEIQWVYDFSKSTLYDGDIQQYSDSKNDKELISSQKPVVLRRIIDLESSTISAYQSLLRQPNLSYDAISILSDHLAKLNDINAKLKIELKKNFIDQSSKQLTTSF